eukprot:scaffold285_cov330-Pavlova_lutheri.AAC.115
MDGHLTARDMPSFRGGPTSSFDRKWRAQGWKATPSASALVNSIRGEEETNRVRSNFTFAQ